MPISHAFAVCLPTSAAAAIIEMRTEENIVAGVALDDDDPGLCDALHVRATETKTIADFGRFSGFPAWAIA